MNLCRKFPDKHVLIANTEKLFISFWGLSPGQLSMLKPTTIFRDTDLPRWHDFLKSKKRSYCEQPQARVLEAEYFSHLGSIGYSYEAGRPGIPFSKVSFDAWSNKSIVFFYHTTTSTSVCNSTIFRHALVSNTTNLTALRQPSSVGYDISEEEWKRDFSNSKFCLVVRGDNPASRSMYRAIRTGCMPLIVSDSLSSYHSLYHSLFSYNDFTLMVYEEDFLKNPVGSLNTVVGNLSKQELRRKVEGLALV